MDCRLNISMTQVHSISVGVEHVVLLSSDGRLFSWGTNKYGQCGVGHSFPVNTPTVCSFSFIDSTNFVIIMCDVDLINYSSWMVTGHRFFPFVRDSIILQH